MVPESYCPRESRHQSMVDLNWIANKIHDPLEKPIGNHIDQRTISGYASRKRWVLINLGMNWKRRIDRTDLMWERANQFNGCRWIRISFCPEHPYYFEEIKFNAVKRLRQLCRGLLYTYIHKINICMYAHTHTHTSWHSYITYTHTYVCIHVS